MARQIGEHGGSKRAIFFNRRQLVPAGDGIPLTPHDRKHLPTRHITCWKSP